MTRTLLLFLSLAAAAAQQVQQHPPLTDQEKGRIDQALPRQAPRKPAKPRKILLTSLCVRDGKAVRGHPAIPYGAYAIEQMGKRTGAYEVVASDDVELFRADTLRQFDAICFNNTLGVLFEDPALRESLLSFVAGGKGLIGFHAAAATFVQHPRYDFWPVFGQMLGGTENGGHPWGPKDNVTFKVDEPNHPLNAAFQGQGFALPEEIYQFQEPDLRGRLRVLLSIDTAKSAPTGRVLAVRQADKDFPMTWIKPHGKGRVFYSSFGHNPEIFWHPRLLEHFLAGIQYALGDLPSDDKPLAPPAAQRLEAVLSQVAKYNYDQGRQPLLDLENVVRALPAADVEKRFLEFLRSDATIAGKDFICRQLSVIGSSASVPLLSAMLVSPDTVEMARYALQRIGGPSSMAALRDGLGKAPAKARPGIVNTLGILRDSQATAALIGLASSSDKPLAASAVAALGRIATPEAVSALRKHGSVEAAEALIVAAEHLASSGNTAAAVGIYRSAPPSIRVAALQGLAAAAGKDALPELRAAITGSDENLQAAAIRFLQSIPGPEATSAMVEDLPGLGVPGRVRMITALANRGERNAVIRALDDNAPEVRVAALESAASVGGPSIVGALAERAASGSPEEREAARGALARMRAGGVDEAVLKAMDGAAPAVKAELIRAAGARGIESSAAALLGALGDSNAGVRREALNALRETAGPSQAPQVLEMLLAAPSQADRRELERVLAAALRRSPPARTSEVVAAYEKAPSPEIRLSLLQAMGQAGAKEALPVLKAATRDANPELGRAAILGLSEWPDDAPMRDLLSLAGETSNPAHQILALRGFLALLGQPSAYPPAEAVAMLGTAMKLARQPPEKKAVLGLLPRYPTPDALAIAQAALADPDVAEEAKMAAQRITRALQPK
jgi:HEAT repeat protein/type 1 glutamine amidotransferase